LDWQVRAEEYMIFSTTLPDEVLIPHCLAGSEQAWSLLIERYSHLIHSISSLKGLSGEEAGDILLQVSLILVLELPRLRDHRRLMAWLIRLTSRECTRRLRKHQTHQGDLREIVYSLPSRCRQLMELLFLTTPAASYDDVARRLGVAGTYGDLIRRRCIEWLKKRLVEEQVPMMVVTLP
jgi:hypothetical protein